MSEWEVQLNIPTTRRKSHHYVISPQGDIAFVTPDAARAFNWLATYSNGPITIRCGNSEHVIEFVDRSPPAEI